jgi:hypothetical protein
MKWIFTFIVLAIFQNHGYNQTLSIRLSCLTDSIWKSHLDLDKVTVILGDWNILANDDTLYHDHRYQVYPFIDGSKKNEYKIEINPIDLIRITSISFQLGVDSLTHYQEIGCCGLEPNNDMYWTWQSGYIGFKLEGQDFENNKWQYHLGGFQWPNRSDQRIELDPSFNLTNKLNLELRLTKELFVEMNRSPYKVMSPGRQSTALMQHLSQSFLIRPYNE